MEFNEGDHVIIKLELQGIKAQVKKAIMSQAEGLAAMVDQEVERMCQPNVIQSLMRDEIKKCIEHSLAYGDAHRLIREQAEAAASEAVRKSFGLSRKTDPKSLEQEKK